MKLVRKYCTRRCYINHQKQKILLLFLLLAVVYPLSAQNGTAVLSHQDLNPTGDPIGGGVGYGKIISPGEAHIVVSNKSELFDALGQAVSGQIVYLDDGATIDLTGEHNIIIPPGVTLASGRGNNGSYGGLLYTTSVYEDDLFYALFETGGEDVRVTGLRLQGPYPEIYSLNYRLGMNGLETNFPGLEVDNNEIWGWASKGISLTMADGAHVHHNYIHHCRRSGFGYGIWVHADGMALIEANLFDFNRHHVASASSSTSSWEARYNVFLEHNVKARLDRHGNGNEGVAGNHTWVHHNWFMGSGEDVVVKERPAGELRYRNNWTDSANLEEAVRLDTEDGLSDERFSAFGNQYGGVSSASLPVADAVVSTTAGGAPLQVRFDGSGSYDNEGSSIVGYGWRFGDGADAMGSRMEGSVVDYTYDEPGRYLVELMVFNERGIPGRTRFPILVQPAGGAYVLSFWIKDSYGGALDGYFKKQALVDGEVVWEDDVSGDEGWDHVVLDIGASVSGKSEIELAFRLASGTVVTDPQNQFIELFMYLDNVFVFGGDVENGDFEEPGGWDVNTDGTYDWSSIRTRGEVRTGSFAFQMGSRYNNPPPGGSYGHLFQPVAIVSPFAQDDVVETPEDVSISVDVLGNDGENGHDNLSVTHVSEPLHGTVAIVSTDAGKVTTGESILYTPDSDFNGMDGFTYTVSDGQGAINLADVTVSVLPVNDVPTFTSDAIVSASQDTRYRYEVLTTDVDGDALSLSAPTLPAWLVFSDRGDGTGELSGTPTNENVGEHQVTLEASDGLLAVEQRFSLVVSDVNDAPVAAADAAATSEDVNVVIDVLANDEDPDSDPLVIIQVTKPPHGQAISIGGPVGMLVQYFPDPDYYGTDAFTYTVSDNRGATAEATVTLSIEPVNDAPTQPVLTMPETGSDVLLQGDPHAPFLFEWTAANDVDGDEVNYTWQLAVSDLFEDLFMSEDTGMSTRFESDQGTMATVLADRGISINDVVTLYHQVVATDGELTTPGSVSSFILTRGALTGTDTSEDLPDRFMLLPNYPNPFSRVTTITYTLPEPSEVFLVVFDMLGREISVLANGRKPAGTHQATFEAGTLPSSLYMYCLEAGEFRDTKLLMLIR